MKEQKIITSKLDDLKLNVYGILNIFPSDTDKTINSLLWAFIYKISDIQKIVEVSDGE